MPGIGSWPTVVAVTVTALMGIGPGSVGSDGDVDEERRATAKNGATVVRYRVEPVVEDSLMQLRVTVRARGEPDGTTRFTLPEDRFGVVDMWRWIRDIEVAPGAEIRAEEPGVFEITHGPGAEFGVAYTVAYDPRRAKSVPFGPSVDGTHFHFFGSQWMGRVGPKSGGMEIVRDLEIQLGAGDADSWSSFGVGAGPHRVRASDYDLDYSVIVGGDYRTTTQDCRGTTIVLGLHGSFELGAADILSTAGRIACAQAEFVADFPRPYFTIFLTERADLEAGAPIPNGFTTFLERTADRSDLTELLSHEMIHTWIPRSARLVEDGRDGAPDVRTRWFHEGFTEYLSRLVLVEIGLQPMSWMVEETNEDLVRLTYQPYRLSTLDELEAARRDGRYNGVHHRLHYARGALLALNWNGRIRGLSNGARSLVHPLREVVELARSGDGAIELDTFASIFARHGIDAAADVERYLEGGVPLRPDSAAFGGDFRIEVRTAAGFDPGFDVRHWLEERNGVLRGVRADGPAYAAGMRDGMELVRVRNAAPWFGRWRPSDPSVYSVATASGERELLIDARNGTVEIPTFVRR